jgi:hypothetical protein
MRIECFGVVCVENKVDMTCGVKRRARSVARKRDEHAWLLRCDITHGSHL